MRPFNYGWELGGKAGRGVGKEMEVEAEANAARRRDTPEATEGSGGQNADVDANLWGGWRRALYAPVARIKTEGAAPAGKE